MEITERKKKILKTVIKEYIMTAQPVGSRTLARRYNFGVSSATIRNEMADLEAAGYLEQPHRSAGRVPSDKGYRFYVDSLMNDEEEVLSPKEIEAIKREYNESKAQEIQELIRYTSQMLSDLTHYTSLASSPRMQKSIFQRLKLVPLTEEKLLIALVTDTGLVQDKVVETSSPISERELKKISRFLNNRLSGLALQEIDKPLLSRISKELVNRVSVSKRDLAFLTAELFSKTSSTFDRVYLDGTTYILEQPEFDDITKVKEVLKVLEHKDLLQQILPEVEGSEGLEILIGEENTREEIKDCSIVIATYNFKGRPVGKIGVLGPTRMDYSKVVSSVRYMSNFLSDFLTNKE